MEERKLSKINCPMECIKTGEMNDGGVFSFYCENEYECHYKDNPHELVGVLNMINEIAAAHEINS